MNINKVTDNTPLETISSILMESYEYPLSFRQLKTLSLLIRMGNLSLKDLLSFISVSEERMNTILNTLIQRGYVYTDSGRYSVTDRGLTQIQELEENLPRMIKGQVKRFYGESKESIEGLIGVPQIERFLSSGNITCVYTLAISTKILISYDACSEAVAIDLI